MATQTDQALHSDRHDCDSIDDYLHSFNFLSSPLQQPKELEIYLSLLSLTSLASDDHIDAVRRIQDRRGASELPPIQIPAQSYRRLTDSELWSKFEEGLCLRCDEVDNADHLCAKKELNLLIVKEQPALMKLRGSIGGEEVVVLVSSGASHNFVDSRVVEKMNLPRSRTEEYCVLGEAEVVKGSTVCRAVGLSLQSVEITADFVPFDMIRGNVDVILGLEWLESLGKVEQNWKKLTMKFDFEDRSVTLQGDRSLSGSFPTLTSLQLYPMSDFGLEFGDKNLPAFNML